MKSVVLYFHVHQPFRLKNYPFFSIGEDRDYFSNPRLDRLDNEKILKKVAEKCYLKANAVLLENLKRSDDFKVSFSISGLALEQFDEFMPEVLESFKSLVDTGKVELVNETYYHSLAYMYSEEEFVSQVKMHAKAMKDIFGYETRAFRNTELIYNNELADIVAEMGFETVLAEGVDRYLGWRSPNNVYTPPGNKRVKLLLKNYKLSDDIAFRFTDKEWDGWPLTAEKFSSWLASSEGDLVNLFMDYETFGEHQWEESGILEFLGQLPEKASDKGLKFMTVSEASATYDCVGVVNIPDYTSWADVERDVSAWTSNPLQQTALASLFMMEKKVVGSKDEKLIDDWRKLTTSDHFYYMSMKSNLDGEVHKYFSPNESAFEAYENFMNVLHDVKQRAEAY